MPATRKHGDADAGWSQDRWRGILDRMEHRQVGVGLRFWGPPLWLEVTMTGPDSDRWPAVGDATRSWDWQSTAPCDVAGLSDRGADDELLAVVSRYTIENLVLNAVHEIGEWFRFDGQRLFPAHVSGGASEPDLDDQGNGAVTLRFGFGPTGHRADAGRRVLRRDALTRLTVVAAPSRFTYLPGTAISYDAAGPTVRVWSDGEPTATWHGAWSVATVAADGDEVVALAGRDVHTALVSHEADRICRAFHVDGRRAWSLRNPACAAGAEPTDVGAGRAASLSISIDYADG